MLRRVPSYFFVLSKMDRLLTACFEKSSSIVLLAALSSFAEEHDPDELAAASTTQRRALLIELRRVCLNADLSIRAAALRSVRCVSRVCASHPPTALRLRDACFAHAPSASRCAQVPR